MHAYGVNLSTLLVYSGYDAKEGIEKKKLSSQNHISANLF